MSEVKIYQSIPYLKKDFQIYAAFVNAFCRKIQSDENDWEDIGNLMLSKMIQPNTLSCIAHRIPDTLFRNADNLTLFPKFTYRELREISQGSYQIRQARSYCQSHLRANNNRFVINVCDNVAVCRKLFDKLIKGTNPLLLSLDLLSRFQSNKKHKVYVLLDFTDEKYVVRGYCCSCRHGCRTVGCCSHVMLIIWYALYIDHSNVRNILPSSNLDHVFDNWNDDYSDSDSISSLQSNIEGDSTSDDDI